MEETPSSPGCVVLLGCDLMMTSTVRSAASSAGLVLHCAASAEEASDVLRAHQGARLLVDLSGEVGIEQLSKIFSEEELQRSVAFGPHVHEQLLDAARQCGIGTVMSRGQFHHQCSAILRESAS